MKRTVPVLAACAVLMAFVVSLPVAAQRGGRGASTVPIATAFDSTDHRFAFPIPPDVSLYTPQAPGPFGNIFKQGYIAYLLNLQGKEITIGVKASPGLTEADLKGLFQVLDANPPQAKRPGFKKVSVGWIKVGYQNDKDAVDYVYTALDEKNIAVTTRQVSLVHDGRGLTFLCSAREKDFEAVNKRTFDELFRRVEFK